MVGVPASANVHVLVCLFQDLGDLRVRRHRREELVDVDCREALCERNVLVLAQRLLAKEQHTVGCPGLIERSDIAAGQVGDVEVGNDRADVFGDGCDLH